MPSSNAANSVGSEDVSLEELYVLAQD